MSLRPVPKPVSTKTTKGKHQNSTSAVFTCKTNGEWGEEIAFTNLLNLGIEEGIVDSFLAEGGHGRGDGRVDRTYRIKLKPATNYDTRAEAPYVDKSGDVYIFRSRKTLGLYKIGTSTRTQQRIKEVNRHFDEDFERIHSVHSDDAYALEHALHVKYAAVLKVGTKEQFWLTDTHLEEIYALKGD